MERVMTNEKRHYKKHEKEGKSGVKTWVINNLLSRQQTKTKIKIDIKI